MKTDVPEIVQFLQDLLSRKGSIHEVPKETAQGNAKSHLSILPTILSAGGEGIKMEEVENGMLRPIPPCKGETATFREYLIANFSFYDIIGDPMVMEVLINRYFDNYEEWLKEID